MTFGYMMNTEAGTNKEKIAKVNELLGKEAKTRLAPNGLTEVFWFNVPATFEREVKNIMEN